MSTRLATLATFPSPVEAALARNILAEAGIRAEATEGATASAWSGMFGGVKLLVDEAELERAGEVLDEALGAPLEAEDEPQDDESEKTPVSDFADNLADRSPAAEDSAWICPSCRARVRNDERRCWSCGASRTGDVNPYYIRPESAVAPPAADEQDIRREPPEHVRDWIDHAWRAACFSALLLPPLLNIYSAWLLLRASGHSTPLPASYSRKFYGALVVNLVVAGMAIVVWTLILR